MHNETRFRKTSINPNTEVEFDSNTLRLYLAIDENKTLIELFRELQLAQAVFKRCMQHLYKFNLIEEVVEKIDYTEPKFDYIEPKFDYIEPEFMDRIHELLIDLSGPLGALLIEEATADMNTEINRIPKAKMNTLISRIAAAIPGTKQATEFKKIMLEELNNSIQ